MKPNFIQINEQKIAYYETKQDGLPVVFIHGNSLSSHNFSKQFENPLLNKKYRLIAMDLTGHGKSSRAKDLEKEYSFQGMISTLIEFVDKLKLNNAVFVGHSLGGNMLLDAANILNTAKGFVIFGAPPIAVPPQMEKYFLPNPAFMLAYKADLNEEEMHTLASAFVNNKEQIINVIADIKKTDPDMRAYLGASIRPENLSDQVKIIENIKNPIAIFHGAEDPLVNGEYYKELHIPMLWQNEIQMISNSGHCPHLENFNEFNLKLKAFLDQIFKN